MTRISRVIGICGFVALLSVPLTLFLWDWRFTWIALAKLVFGVVAIGFWLVFNRRGLRRSFQGRSVFYGSFAGLFTAMAVFLLVAVNYISYRYPVQWDLTEEQLFSLSPQTTEILAGLTDVVEVRAFYGPKESEYALVSTILDRYRYASEKFVYEFVDPEVQLDQVEEFKINLGGPRIVMRFREREERVKLGGREQNGPEEALTAALLRLVGSEAKNRVCFTTGHGEKSLSGDDPREILTLWQRDLEGEGYAIDALSLLEVPEVPPSCNLVIVAGPRMDFTPAEVQSLHKYLQGGGKLMAFLGAADSRSLDALLAGFGLRLGQDTVIFPKGRSPLNAVTDPVHYPAAHPIFSRFFTGSTVVLSQLQAVFPMSRSVSRSGPPTDLEVVELAMSSANAWAESDDVQKVEQISFDPDKDKRGPVPLAAVVEAKESAAGPRREMRLAVFGSSMFPVDMAYRIYPFNRNLTMNTLAWLTREEKKITIRPRFRAASLLRLEESQLKFITFFSSDILPLLILALGITIWQVRRWS